MEQLLVFQLHFNDRVHIQAIYAINPPYLIFDVTSVPEAGPIVSNKCSATPIERFVELQVGSIIYLL